ncbi:MAG: DUF1841 family protein [Gammaproteobacteria bacterium]|nr:DUF1841 family protein [Gammaproteobacteria bacterium]
MIFTGDRRQMRDFFRAAWHKRQRGEALQPLEELIASVIADHPEYHPYLESEQELELDFAPESGATNPFLHMGMHIAIREQVATDRPSGIAAVHQSLRRKFANAGDAEHRMMECLGESLWRAQRDNRLPDENAYLDCLQRLRR